MTLQDGGVEQFTLLIFSNHIEWKSESDSSKRVTTDVRPRGKDEQSIFQIFDSEETCLGVQVKKTVVLAFNDLLNKAVEVNSGSGVCNWDYDW